MVDDALVAFIARSPSLPGLGDYLLAEHAADDTGHCPACTWVFPQVWPCEVYAAAFAASGVERSQLRLISHEPTFRPTERTVQMTATLVETNERYIAASARVPQGAGHFAVPTSTEPPSTGGARPFALRFGLARIPTADVAEQATWRYSDELQIAVEAGGQPRMAKGSMTTTGQSTDGTGSTGGEEWTPDFAGDFSL